MTRKLLLILSIMLSFAIKGAYAQNVEFEKEFFKDRKEDLKIARKAIDKGNEIYDQGINLTDALNQYSIAQKVNPNNAWLNYRIGMCYLAGYDKAKSLPYFENAYKLKPQVTADLIYQLGFSYQLNYKFDEAIAKYKEASIATGKDNPITPDIVNKRIQECKYGKEYVAKPERVFIDNVGPQINTASNEYSPVISADESTLMFTSRRPGSTGEEKDPNDQIYYEDIYNSRNVDGVWLAPTNPGKPLNSELHDATVGLSNDGQRLFIYKTDNGGDIYECVQKGEQWVKPEELNKNINSKAHEPSASLSPDGRTIYFSSNREGGYGNHDIYMCTLNKKGKWGEAINLGPGINTPYDEDAVFMHPDGKTLYFSSKGHTSMGGFDIFKTVLENGKWSLPVNLGYPVNTPDDDRYFVLSASGEHGYYSSVRDNGFGGHDLYMITFLGEEKPVVNNSEDNLLASATAPIRETVIEPVVAVKTSQLTILKGTVTDAMSKLPVGAKIELTDNKLNEIIATFESNNKSGKYLVSLPAGRNYGIAVKAENYLFHSENFDIPETAGFQEIVKDIELKKIAVGSRIILRNIFFDFDKATLRPESTTELENLAQILKDYPTMKIEISGHTDSKGSDTYNQTLSQNRAQSVVNYLVTQKGIDKARLEFKGYGESMPISTNETEEGRQLNRRTEFKILSK